MAQAQKNIPALTSRRNFIKSSAALAVAGVSNVTLAKAGMAHPDRALFEAIAEWQGGHEEQERLSGILSQLEDLAGETEPPMPSELFEALEIPGEKRLPDMSVGWTESSLRDFVERGQLLRSSMEKLPNDAMRTDLWWDDISPATRQRAAELLQVKLDHTAKLDAHWEKAQEAEGRFSDQALKQSDKMMEIAGMSVCTGEGLAAKCQMLLAEPVFCDMAGDLGSEAGFIAKSLIADIREAVDRGAFTA
jgi:hypothetical protein